MRKELEEAGIPQADEEGRVVLAKEFAQWVKAYKPHAEHSIAWLQVFKEVDNDNSGLLTFDELREVVRRKFKLKKFECSENKLKLIWCALDMDDSDTIQQIEFGRFIKLAYAKKSDRPAATPRKSGSLSARPKVSPLWKPGKLWNTFAWAPSSAETNFLGGPWAPAGHKLVAVMPRSPRHSPRKPPAPILPPLKATPREIGMDGRWPYREEPAMAPSWRTTSTSRSGTASRSVDDYADEF